MHGAIGFSARRYNLLSRLIRWLTNSKYSHTFIVIDDVEKISCQTRILQASGWKVQVNTLDEYLKPGIDICIYLLDKSEEDKEKAIQYCNIFLKEPYGFFQLIGFLPVFFLRKLGIQIKNPISYGVPCSELVWRFMNCLGISEIQKIDRDSITPEQELEVLEKISIKKIMIIDGKLN